MYKIIDSETVGTDEKRHILCQSIGMLRQYFGYSEREYLRERSTDNGINCMDSIDW